MICVKWTKIPNHLFGGFKNLNMMKKLFKYKTEHFASL